MRRRAVDNADESVFPPCMWKRRRAMVRLSLAGLLLAALVVSSASSAKPRPNLELTSISAQLFPLLRETHYRVTVRRGGGNEASLKATWKITLELVDKAGTANPGTPGSGAGVDLGCTNDGVGWPNPEHASLGRAESYGLLFVWHHPDAADSEPPGKYHCDHRDMGPRGHQGLITFVVSDKEWLCKATYKGTDSSKKESIADGTASEPTCTKLAR